MAKSDINPRLLQRGDIILDGDGNEQVVRSVSMIVILASGIPVEIDTDERVVVIEDEEISEVLRKQIEALESEGWVPASRRMEA